MQNSRSPKDKLILAAVEAGIEKEIKSRGPTSHNVIGTLLLIADAEVGRKEANQFIKVFNLTKMFGIHPVEESKIMEVIK